MEIRITFIPATFDAHSYCFAIPYTPIHTGVYGARNVADLEKLVSSLAATRQEKPAIISLTPLNRKINGFDKWKKANRQLLEIRGASQ